MKKLLAILITMITLLNTAFAQVEPENKTHRKGLVFGLGLGAGTLTLKTNESAQTAFSATLPNLKAGYMLSDRLAALALLPGATYKQNGKDRGFEGVLLAAQYWPVHKWWLLGGAGLTFDAPAFYTVDDPATAEFNTGLPALAFSTGYEVYRKGKFTIDLSYRIFLGTANLPNNGKREGISNLFIVGFNWY